MPVKREGRFTVADPMEVQTWLGQQSHMPKPAHILTNETRPCSSPEGVLGCYETEEVNVRTLQTYGQRALAQRLFQS